MILWPKYVIWYTQMFVHAFKVLQRLGELLLSAVQNVSFEVSRRKDARFVLNSSWQQHTTVSLGIILNRMCGEVKWVQYTLCVQLFKEWVS